MVLPGSSQARWRNRVLRMPSMQLRMVEDAKIHCAREHFKAISGENVVYDVVDSYTILMEKDMK